jgi:hypothetical protein
LHVFREELAAWLGTPAEERLDAIDLRDTTGGGHAIMWASLDGIVRELLRLELEASGDQLAASLRRLDPIADLAAARRALDLIDPDSERDPDGLIEWVASHLLTLRDSLEPGLEHVPVEPALPSGESDCVERGEMASPEVEAARAAVGAGASQADVTNAALALLERMAERGRHAR